jgi:hypothetical protein
VYAVSHIVGRRFSYQIAEQSKGEIKSGGGKPLFLTCEAACVESFKVEKLAD